MELPAQNSHILIMHPTQNRVSYCGLCMYHLTCTDRKEKKRKEKKRKEANYKKIIFIYFSLSPQ